MKTLGLLLCLQFIFASLLVSALDQPVCKEIGCANDCTYGFAIDATGCPTCECRDEVCQGVTCGLGKICKKFLLTHTNTEVANCIDPTLPEQCQQPMDSGKCRGSQIRWFYDTETEQCQNFPYGGCSGNANRFETKAECDDACQTKCGDVRCMMYCENGFKKDARGCEICLCADENDPAMQPAVPQNKNFVVGLGCDENGEVMCDLHCPFGFEVDVYGCETCKCNLPPTCQRNTCNIDIHCDYGFKTGEDGCPTCECRAQGECNEFVCQMYCEFGMKTDKNGCKHCECNPNPCKTFACPQNTYCILNSTGDTTPSCLMHESWSTSCPQVSCMLHCDNGFKSDVRGCPVCECLEEPKEACPDQKCRKFCEFGFQKDPYGCDECKCLPNPCEDQVCEKDEVCETINDCIGQLCTHTGRCLDKEEIKRVRVQVSFSHEKPLDKENMAEFLMSVRENFAKILKVEESQITNIKAKQENQTVHVTFHLVGDGKEGLVEAWQTAETHISTKAQESAITYDGQEFVPQHNSLVSLYSSNASEHPYDGEGDGSATITVVIACAVVGAVVLVAAGIVSVFVKKSKKQEKKRKNVIYKKAPEERSTDSLA